MQFANPIWLWALTGLSIPLAIHLLSRKEGKVIRIGSLRHLQETTTQQFKGIRLNELALLTLRCFLIILFVLLLSGLSFRENKKNNIKWVLVEKGLENNQVVKTQLEDLIKEEYEARFLTEGFPLLADSTEDSQAPSYWKLAEELLAKDLDAVVISKNRLENYSGMRPSFPSNIRWISIPVEPANYTLSAISSQDSVIVKTGHTNTEYTSFTTKTSSIAGWNDSIT
ncbi:MAG TPA: BatA domain-containing protein, partial [Cyclobacteriaceae bacterium]